MRAVDTNVLVRLIARDDARQLESAEDFVAKGAWVSHLVLAESSWVLDSVYGLEPKRIAVAIDMLLNHAHLTIESPEAVAAALENYRKRPAINFSDYLIVEIARKNGHLPLATFDRDLAKVAGAQRL